MKARELTILTVSSVRLDGTDEALNGDPKTPEVPPPPSEPERPPSPEIPTTPESPMIPQEPGPPEIPPSPGAPEVTPPTQLDPVEAATASGDA